MVERDNTYMEAVIPRIKFIEPMGYEMNAKLIEGYVKIILESKQDTKYPKWGTYEERSRIVQSELYSKERKKKVEKEIDSILKEYGMTRQEFNEINGIMLEMKSNGQIKVLEPNPIVVVGPLEGVTMAQPYAQVPIAQV